MQSRCTQLTLLLFVLISLVACKKDHTPPAPPAPPVVKVKTIAAGTVLNTYFYDNKGRVARIEFDGYGKTEYIYADTGIVVSFYDTTGAFKGKEVYKLGANGLAVSSYNSNTTTDQYVYTYTSSGQLSTSSTIRTLAGPLIRRWDYSYYYTNNNLDSTLVSYTNGSSVTKSVYAYYDEYYTDKTNTTGNDNLGQAFRGASSKNPVKAARDIGMDSQGNMPQTNYSYEYDVQGNITKVLHVWGSSPFTPVIYTYY